ncbi:hypothetical protein WN51_06508 [Melipona quadrifasciata]|uniref:Uncharacterized protein n=1 Tax=Melipona quadrifasciata TaxID=166423 RepID=A0A0M8ZQL0_9HYME|nr:hypothetical protein WN51_06508 [Melipona quadrifasciata]
MNKEKSYLASPNRKTVLENCVLQRYDDSVERIVERDIKREEMKEINAEKTKEWKIFIILRNE